MELKRIEPFKTIRALYYANKPAGKYKPFPPAPAYHSYMPPEPSFWEKLSNTFKLIFHK